MSLSALRDTLHSASVLLGAGMVDPRRPLLAATSLRATRRLGAIAGPAHISARRNPEDVALIDDLGSVTYGDLDRRTNALARGLSGLEVSTGSVVGVLGRDHRGVVEVMVAAGKLGARLVLLNTGFARPQLADVAEREGVGVLIVDEEFLDLVDALPVGVHTVLAWSTELDAVLPTTAGLIAAHTDRPLPLPDTQGGMVLLTGGTTGTPKGAPRTIGSPLVAAQFLERVPQRRGDVVLIAAPTFHGTGLSQLIMALALGSTVVLRRRFDALATLQALEEHRVSVLILVPTMLSRILALEDELDTHDTSALRIIMSAGAALPTDLGNRATERFGPVMHNLYGCTEVALATVATPADWAAAPGTVGRPPRGIRVELLDDQDRPVTEPGVVGRIFVDNGLKFTGYSGGGTKPTVGDLMATGDTGHRDADGRLFVDGRDDDMIVSGGENVFPGEIEDLVASLTGVADVATLPVEDPDFGTRLRLFVVLDGTRSLSEQEIKEHVRTYLARFKVPREVVFVEAIPYTPTGKVARSELAGLATSGLPDRV